MASAAVTPGAGRNRRVARTRPWIPEMIKEIETYYEQKRQRELARRGRGRAVPEDGAKR